MRRIYLFVFYSFLGRKYIQFSFFKCSTHVTFCQYLATKFKSMIIAAIEIAPSFLATMDLGYFPCSSDTKTNNKNSEKKRKRKKRKRRS